MSTEDSRKRLFATRSLSVNVFIVSDAEIGGRANRRLIAMASSCL